MIKQALLKYIISLNWPNLAHGILSLAVV